MTLNFTDLKKKVSINAVLNDKGLNTRFKKRGDRLVGPCPIHGGDNPNAFVISISKNQWYCFTGCGRGGDIVEFVRCLDKVYYRQVAEYLTSLAGIAPTALNHETAKVFRPYTLSLPLNYDSIFLRQKAIKHSTAKRFEAGAYYGKGFLMDCVGIRLHDINGKPVGYAGRRLNSHQVKQYGKWKFPNDLPKSRLLYNFHRIKSCINNGLFVVEGPWDVMRLAQLNIPAVALLGLHVSNFQFEILRKFPRIIFMLDGDNAGRKSTEKHIKRFESATSVDYIILPYGCDPDDLYDETLLTVTRPFISY